MNERPRGSVDQREATLVDRLTSWPVGKGGRDQRETGDRMIGWGHLFRSRVSAVGSLGQVFRFGCWFRA